MPKLVRERLRNSARTSPPYTGQIWRTTSAPCAVRTAYAPRIAATNRAVALTSGGDAIGRAQSRSQRLDVADARTFLGEYLALP